MEPQFIVLLVTFLVVGGVVAGFRRGESRATIALNVVGYLVFMGGLAWASELGGEAILAAGAASLGSLMFTTAGSVSGAGSRLPPGANRRWM